MAPIGVDDFELGVEVLVELPPPIVDDAAAMLPPWNAFVDTSVRDVSSPFVAVL
jgi:hypothetical protein